MKLKQIHFNESFPLMKEQKQILEDVISWKTPPPIIKTGRSSYLTIDEDILPFSGIKMKGCGFFNLHEKTALKPLEKESYDAHEINAADGIKEIHYQIEVNDKDELCYAVPSKRPFGAQTFNRAKLEYDVNNHLLENWHGDSDNFPFYYPLAYAEYEDIDYNGESLGVTLLGMPVIQEIPLANYFEGGFEKKGLRVNPHLVEYWGQHNSAAGVNEPDYFALLDTIKKLCFNFGKTLSNFHKHFVDYDSHFFNATVNVNNGDVVLYDFDHAIKVEDISAQKYYYYALKDFEIGLVAVLSNFLLSGLIEGILLFEEEDKQIEDFNIISSFFEGYFGDLSGEASQHAKAMWRRLLLFAHNEIIPAKKTQHIHFAHAFCEQERENSYIDTYSYMLDFISKRKSISLSQEKHKKIISSLLKQRDDLAKSHKN